MANNSFSVSIQTANSVNYHPDNINASAVSVYVCRTKAMTVESDQTLYTVYYIFAVSSIFQRGLACGAVVLVFLLLLLLLLFLFFCFLTTAHYVNFPALQNTNGIFDSSQLSDSFNVQDGGKALVAQEYHYVYVVCCMCLVPHFHKLPFTREEQLMLRNRTV